MDVNEVIVFVCYSLLDSYVEYLCDKNRFCFKVDFRRCCFIDLDYDGGLDVIFLIDGFNGVFKDDYKIGFKFV